MFVENKTKVASGVGCSEKRVVYLDGCCLSPIRRNSVLEELRVQDWQSSMNRSVIECFVSDVGVEI